MDTTTQNRNITLATVKSFIRKNQGRLYIKVRMSFDPQSDCLDDVKDDFHLVTAPLNPHTKYDFGISGAWFWERNSFKYYEDLQFIGIEVSNCCRYFVLAVRKEAL